MHSWTSKCLLLLAFLWVGGGSAVAQSRLPVTVYTAAETEHLAVVKQAVEAALPTVEVRWVRGSTGSLTARLISERGAPVADLILGLSSQSLAQLKALGALRPYVPPSSASLDPRFNDQDEPRSWTGLVGYSVAVCFNSELGKALGLPKPRSWRDLADPIYRRHIAMPHPASSGVGVVLAATWLRLMGEETAWAFMKDLHANMPVYTVSGVAPCVQAARGERLIGLSFDTRAVRERSQGAPIELIYPLEGVGWELSGMALVSNRPPAQTAAAMEIINWATSVEAHRLFGRFFNLVARPDAQPNDAPTPPLIGDYPSWVGRNRDRIILEWESRIGAQ